MKTAAPGRRPSPRACIAGTIDRPSVRRNPPELARELLAVVRRVACLAFVAGAPSACFAIAIAGACWPS
jgi:hypothetical protein